jgi:simple sugar transport system ATP-binding protein
MAYLDLVRIRKTFPPATLALDDVSLSCERGEIHAIVGENGAGKSTLMKVLYGLEHADSGTIEFDGRRLAIRSPRDALAAGIGMVHQELVQVPEFTVWENVVLGIEPVGPFGSLNANDAARYVQSRIDEFGFGLRAGARLGDLSVAARQKIEILKLLCRDVRVLILDEPTAVLTPQEIPPFFDELRRLRDAGRTLLFISHHLDEVLELCDRVTVLRRGVHVATRPAAELTRSELATLMVGRDVDSQRRVERETILGPVVLQLDALRVAAADGRPALIDVSLQVHESEIVGVAGVEGNGQAELVETLIGLTAPERIAGFIQIAGVRLTRNATILERRRHLSFVPADRGGAGSALQASVVDNVLMGHHRLDPAMTWAGGAMLNNGAARRLGEGIRQRYDVSLSGLDAPMRSLSGGNQQKVILGRELAAELPLLILDQPTRGLDVSAAEFVHNEILAQRDLGRAILMVSSDLEELLALADRVLVLHRGRLAGSLPIAEATIERVGRLMLTGSDDAS